MEEQKRETLLRMFPEYDVDTLLTSMSACTIEQIADWCLNNPGRVPMKRKGEKRKAPAASPPNGHSDSDSDLDFDDIADGLILDRLTKELLNKLKKEISQQNNKSEATANEVKYALSAIFPTLRMDFIKIAYAESGFRLCAALIICFFVSNKITQRLRDAMPNPQSNMWIMTDTVKSARKKILLDIFDGDISHYGENVTMPIKKFVTMMNDLTEKYPLIVNRLQLLPDAFQLRLDVPDDIEKFDCGVCFCEYTITRRIMCGTGQSSDERHSFCRSCVKQQAQAATEEMPLADGGIGLKCMAYECKNPILYSAVRNLIPKRIRRKIDERIMEENIGNSGLNLERCRDCNFAIEMDESKEENKVFSCPNCEKNWCRLCEREWDDEHFGRSCAEVDEKNNVDKKQRELERKLNEAVIRKCKCGLQFTKSDGCNKMTCRCGKTQCYLCRQEGITYTHFCQHVRNPGIQQCQHCNKKCTLWADANQLDQQILNRIRAENGEAADPDAPGPSRAGNRQPTPPPLVPLFNQHNYVRIPPMPVPPPAYGLQQHFVPQPMPPIPIPRYQPFHGVPDGINIGYNNGPQGFNFNLNIENPLYHVGYRNLEDVYNPQQRAPQQDLQQNHPRRRVVEAAPNLLDAEGMRAEQRRRVQERLDCAAARNAQHGVDQAREEVRDRAGPRRVMPDMERYRVVRARSPVRDAVQQPVVGGAVLQEALEQYQQNRRAERERQKREEAQPRIERHIRDLERMLQNNDAPTMPVRPNQPDYPYAARPNPLEAELLHPRQRELDRVRHQYIYGRPLARNNEALEDALDFVRRDRENNERVRPAQNNEARADPPKMNIVRRVDGAARRENDERNNAGRDRPASNNEALNEYVQRALRDYGERNNIPLPQNNDGNARNAARVRFMNYVPRQPEPRIPPLPQQKQRQVAFAVKPEVIPQREPPRQARRRTPIRANFMNILTAQDLGPVGGNALNNEVPPRFMGNQGDRVEVRVPPPQVIVHQHEPIVGRILNAQNDMEPPLHIRQNVFEQPAVETEDVPLMFQNIFDEDSTNSGEDSSSDDDDDEIDMEQDIIDNEPLVNAVDAVLEQPQQPQEEPAAAQVPIEIDLTQFEDDVPAAETDLKHIERIHDKGERFEVMPIDMNSHVQEARKLDDDWKYVYKLVAELQTSNQKMRESMNVNDTGRQPEKTQGILGTLDKHDEIANIIMQKMPELNAQTEILNNL